MGFNKRILPNIDKVKEVYNMDPDSYIKGIIKTDSLIGPMESINWVEKKIKEYYDKRKSIK